MHASQLRSRKDKENSSLRDGTVTITEEKSSRAGLVTVVVKEEKIENWAVCFVNELSCLFHSKIILPFWSHLDVRGFGTPQPFICWLLIPFTLSMIVWYVAVKQLIEMGNMVDEAGPMPIYPVTEEFVWGEEL